jgi:hypothetical protein
MIDPSNSRTNPLPEFLQMIQTRPHYFLDRNLSMGKSARELRIKIEGFPLL